MAIIDLKTNLSKIEENTPNIPGLDDVALPKVNIFDVKGDVNIEYHEKNKFQSPLDRDRSKLEIQWDSKKDSYYARGLKQGDELHYGFSPRVDGSEPYVIRPIGEKWGPDAMSSWDAGIIRGGAGTLAGRVLGDVERVGKFVFSPKGLAFSLKQGALQALNPGGDLGERANIYNPLSPIENTLPIRHAKRHIELGGASDILRIGVSSFAPAIGLHYSDFEAARYRSGVAQIMKHGMTKYITSVLSGGVLEAERKQVRAIGDKSSDSVNLIPYGSRDAAKRNGETEDTLDFIPFRFKDLNNNKYIVFRALLSGISDNITPEFAAERYVGRPDQVYIYQGTNREITFTFDVYPKSRKELPVLWDKLNYLVGLTYPSWTNARSGLGMVSPFIELTIGDMYYNTPGFLSQLNLTVQDGSTWEIDDWKLPKHIQAACSFTYIGNYLPNQIGKHYELPWLKDSNTPPGSGTYPVKVKTNEDKETTVDLNEIKMMDKPHRSGVSF